MKTNSSHKLEKIIKKIIKEEKVLLESNILLHRIKLNIPMINAETSDNEYVTMLKTELNKNFVYDMSSIEYKGDYNDPKSGENIKYIHGNTINKPIGLWFGKKTSWLKHCIENHMTNFLGNHIYKININKGKLLNISKSNIKKVNQYTVPVNDYGDYKIVDWGKIMNDYAGAYFENNLDDDFMFDMGIDVYNTGCIWNLNEGITGFYKWNYSSRSWEEI